MNSNRRRSAQSKRAGFWSNLMGRTNGTKEPIDHYAEEFEHPREPAASLGRWQWEDVSRHIPFILYCTLLLLIYIANSHNQESVQRKILSTRQEVEDLKAEYILLQSEVMYLSRRTEVLNRLQNMGMGWKSPQDPPIRLESPQQEPSPKKSGT